MESLCKETIPDPGEDCWKHSNEQESRQAIWRGIPINTKHQKLLQVLRGFESITICYSGGVDSTLLLAVCRQALGDRVLAVTAESPIHADSERVAARETVGRLGVKHIVFASREMQQENFLENPKDRCYHCKRLLFADIVRISTEQGIPTVAHGANRDDLQDFRPGFRAAEEYGIQAPLITAGFTKSDVRLLSKHLGLPTWNRPAMPCLATRIPYGVRITNDLLRRVEAAEAVLQAFGFHGCRVRIFDTSANVELLPRDIAKAASPPLAEQIVEKLKALGFTSVSLDLEGYRRGSMNVEKL